MNSSVQLYTNNLDKSFCSCHMLFLIWRSGYPKMGKHFFTSLKVTNNESVHSPVGREIKMKLWTSEFFNGRESEEVLWWTKHLWKEDVQMTALLWKIIVLPVSCKLRPTSILHLVQRAFSTDKIFLFKKKGLYCFTFRIRATAWTISSYLTFT